MPGQGSFLMTSIRSFIHLNSAFSCHLFYHPAIYPLTCAREIRNSCSNKFHSSKQCPSIQCLIFVPGYFHLIVVPIHSLPKTHFEVISSLQKTPTQFGVSRYSPNVLPKSSSQLTRLLSPLEVDEIQIN